LHRAETVIDALLKSWLSVKPNRLPKTVHIEGDIPPEVKMNFNKCGVVEGLDLLVTEGHRDDYKLRRECADKNVPMILSSELALEISRAMIWLTDRELNADKSFIKSAKLITLPSYTPEHDSIRKKGI
jgi:hypothetical protein